MPAKGRPLNNNFPSQGGNRLDRKDVCFHVRLQRDLIRKGENGKGHNAREQSRQQLSRRIECGALTADLNKQTKNTNEHEFDNVVQNQLDS